MVKEKKIVLQRFMPRNDQKKQEVVVVCRHLVRRIRAVLLVSA